MNDRFKFRVWDIEDCSYICRNDFDDIWFDKDGELHIGMYSDFTQGIEDYTDQVIIEQCTGLKDKNGNLIYESDYVKDRWGTKYIIKWVDAKFIIVDVDDTLPDTSPRQDWFDKIGIEIIDNIHEQKEQ